MMIPLQFGFQFIVDIPLLVKLAPLFLILAGIASAARLLERAFGVAPAEGSRKQLLIIATIYLGLIIGVLCIISVIQILMTGGSIFQSFLIMYLAAISGVQSVYGFTGYLLGLILQYRYYFWIDASYTYGILIFVGFALIMRPIKMVPWSVLLALLAGVGVTILVWRLLNVGIQWLILIFVVTLCVTYLLSKFIESIFKAIVTILTFPVIAVPLGIICIIQGVLLLIGSTLPNLWSPPLFGLF